MEWAIQGSTGPLKNAWYVNGWGCAVRPSILLQSWRLLHWNPYLCLGLHWPFRLSKEYCNAKVMSSVQEPAKMSNHAWTNSLNPGFSMDFFFLNSADHNWVTKLLHGHLPANPQPLSSHHLPLISTRHWVNGSTHKQSGGKDLVKF